jgi:transcriptional regulator with XRE-family HTH domain
MTNAALIRSNCLALCAIIALTEKNFLSNTENGQVEKSKKVENFSERLRWARIRRGFNQEQLAKELGFSKGAVGNWESDANIPTPGTLRKIADLLGVSVDYLLTGVPDLRENPDETFGAGVAYAMRAEGSALVAQCREYFDAFLESCRDEQARLGWTLVELRAHFPLDKWESGEATEVILHKKGKGTPSSERLLRRAAEAKSAAEKLGIVSSGKGSHSQSSEAGGRPSHTHPPSPSSHGDAKARPPESEGKGQK